MAVQFATAWSSVIRGVGVIAGGPYWCAKADSDDFINGFMLPILTATGPCMTGPPPDLNIFIAKADAKAASGDIDPLQNLSKQKVYLFHGYNDAVVAKSVTDAAADFYRHYLGDASRGNLYYQTAVGAGHSLVVLLEPGVTGLNACPDSQLPFIDQCGYDQAGILLQHIYGALNPPNRGQIAGTVQRFDQSVYAGSDGTSALSLGETGFVFVPKDCEAGQACRVHIALHGCKQDAGDIDRRFIDATGYNAWADTNHLIILYPQTAASPFLPTKSASLLGLVELRQPRGQLCHQVRSADQDDQSHAGCLDSARNAYDRRRGVARCSAERVHGCRHIGHQRGSGLDPRRRGHHLPRLARGRRWHVRDGRRCRGAEFRRLRPDAGIGLSLACLGRRERDRGLRLGRGSGHDAIHARPLRQARQLPDWPMTKTFSFRRLMPVSTRTDLASSIILR